MTHELAHDAMDIDAQEAERMHEAMDYAQHRQTWDLFTNLIKWGVIGCAVLMLALYIFINP